MTINLWLKDIDKELFADVCNAELSEYLDDILTSQLGNPGILGRIGKKFTLGKKGIWIPKDTDQKFHFVYIKNNSAYPEGLILTPYSSVDVEYHLKGVTIDKTTGIHREELMGSDQDDFVRRVFRTYGDTLIRKFDERDNHLVLYSSDRGA